MDRLMSFFRVFDIAFFAPGTLLVAAWHFAGTLRSEAAPEEETLREAAEAAAEAASAAAQAATHLAGKEAAEAAGAAAEATVAATEAVQALSVVGGSPATSVLEGVLQLILLIGVIYGLGLMVHAVRERLFERAASRHKNGSGTSWYSNLEGDPKVDLTLYFWYLRATCWNLAFALPIAALILIGRYFAEILSGFYPAAYWILAILGTTVLTYALDRLGSDFDGALKRAAK